ncbi:secondary thiamine-phosphate synthase enzyme YjbQ [Thermosulfuriphilus sp.]
MVRSISVKSNRKTELIDITEVINRELDIDEGICLIYCPHTTGGIIVNEGADPAVAEDVTSVLNEVVPWHFPYRHLEGNSPAHVKASLTGPSVLLIVEGGQLKLGTWQRVFFCEYDGPRSRKVWIKTLKA